MHPSAQLPDGMDHAAARARTAAPGAEPDAEARPGRRYVLTVFALLAFGMAAVVALLVGTAWMGRDVLPFQAILEHQRAKLAAGAPEVVFVGDSSLGNAIDAAEWQRLTGDAAANLALTGAYGYAGSLAMLQEALDHGPVRLAVVMQTATLMSLPPLPLAERSVRVPATPWERLHLWWTNSMNMPQVAASWRYLVKSALRAVGVAAGDPQPRIANDYVAQGGPITPDDRLKDLGPRDIVPGKAEALYRIGALCRAAGITCVYAHGPLVDAACARIGPYLAEVNRIIRDTGLVLVDEQPYCFPRDAIGDSLDHIAPALKQDTTRAYAEAITAAAARAGRPERPGRSQAPAGSGRR